MIIRALYEPPIIPKGYLNYGEFKKLSTRKKPFSLQLKGENKKTVLGVENTQQSLE